MSCPSLFLANLLISEEGSYAYLAVDNGLAKISGHHNLLLIGREKGKDRWDTPEHPVLPYLFFTKFIRPLTSGTDFLNLSIREKTILARLPFYSLYLLSWIIIFLLHPWFFKLRSFRSLLLPLGIMTFVGTWRLTVGGGVQTIFDGNYGLLLLTLSAFGIYGGQKVESFFYKNILFFLGGFIAGLGKNEWALALLLGLSTAFVIIWSYNKFLFFQNQFKRANLFFLFVFLGLLGGAAFNFFMDPNNYLAGFHVMRRFTLQVSTTPLSSFVYRLPWIWPHFLLLFTGIYFIIINFKDFTVRRAPQLVLFLWGTFQLLGFLVPPHLGDGFPRYFCPSLIALLLFVLSGLENQAFEFRKTGLIILLVWLGVGYNAYYLKKAYYAHVSIGSIPGLSLTERQALFEKQYRAYLETRKALKADSAVAYYYPDMDFVNNS